MKHDDSGAPGQAEALPDLTALDLGALRALDHPVLGEVLDGLRERAGTASELLWGFNNAM
jgi:FXSXX-COOH protein